MPYGSPSRQSAGASTGGAVSPRERSGGVPASRAAGRRVDQRVCDHSQRPVALAVGEDQRVRAVTLAERASGITPWQATWKPSAPKRTSTSTCGAQELSSRHVDRPFGVTRD